MLDIFQWWNMYLGTLGGNEKSRIDVSLCGSRYTPEGSNL